MRAGVWMCRECRCVGMSWVQVRVCRCRCMGVSWVQVRACRCVRAGACVEVQVRGCVVGAGALVCRECRRVCVHVLYVQVCIMCVHVCRARLTFNCSANSTGCLAVIENP